MPRKSNITLFKLKPQNAKDFATKSESIARDAEAKDIASLATFLRQPHLMVFGQPLTNNNTAPRTAPTTKLALVKNG